MINLTKEWLLRTIAELEEERDSVPGAVNEDAAKALEAMKIALASLEAKPVISHVGSKNALDDIVAFIKSNRNPTLKDHNQVSERLFQDNCHGLSNHVIEYIKQIGEELEELRSTQDTAPPAPVSVPDAMDGQGGVCCEVSYADGWNSCRAAMLQGAEPVAKAYKLRDAVEKIRNSGIAIDAEKILEERDVLNSPVIPDGWVMVPVEPTEGMIAAAMSSDDVLFDTEDDTMFRVQHAVIWQAMLAAAPQQEVKS